MVSMINYYPFMEEALRLAGLACAAGEVPVGAVIVDRTSGEILGRGYNRCESMGCAVRHAEIEAIEQASACRGGWRLDNTALVVTLEPCLMCAGAIVNSRIETVVFGAWDVNMGAVDSVVRSFSLPLPSKPEFIPGVMEPECRKILTEFFARRRSNKNV